MVLLPLRISLSELDGRGISTPALDRWYLLDLLPTRCFRLIETCRVAYLSEAIPEHIVGVILRHIVVILVSNHTSRSHELTPLQVEQVDVPCPLLQAISKRHDHDVTQFVIGQISQLAIQLLDITGPQPYIIRLRAQTIVRTRKVIRPQILDKVVRLDRVGSWLPLCFLMQPGVLAAPGWVRVAASTMLPLLHHGLRVLSLACDLRGNYSFWRNFGFLRQFGRVLMLACLLFIGLVLLICPGYNRRTLLRLIATMDLFGRSLLMSLWHLSSPLVSLHFPYFPSKNS